MWKYKSSILVAALIIMLAACRQEPAISPERQQAMDLTEQAIRVIEYDRPAGTDMWGAALELLDEAIRVDSTYAKAWAVSALPRFAQVWTESWDFDTWIPATREAADRALALDSTLAYAHFANGVALIAEGGDRADLETISAAFERALALDSGFAEAEFELAMNAMRRGRFSEALERAERALALDPESIRMMAGLAVTQVAMGRFDDALETYERIGARDPLYGDALDNAIRAYIGKRDYGSTLTLAEQVQSAMGLGAEIPERAIEQAVLGQKAWALFHLGRLDEALSIFESLGNIYGQARIDAVAGRAEAAAGHLAEMERRLAETDQWGWEWGIGDIHLAMGDMETAIGWLERALATRIERQNDLDNFLWWLRYYEFYDPIREDPRIQSMLNRYPVD